MSGGYFLTSARLGWRRWRRGDAGLAAQLWGDPKVTALIDARGALSERQVRARLAQELRTGRRCGVQYWPIFLLAGGEFVGCCGLRPYAVMQRTFEIGFHIRAAHWRRGYAIEAARTVIDHAFGELDAARLFAGHNPRNEASRRLLVRLGFCYSHDEYYPPTGLQHPSYWLHRA